MGEANPMAALCRVLAVSESGYHAWCKRSPSSRAQMNVRRETEIQAAHERTRQPYDPERLGHKRGLRCKQKCTFIATTDSAHTLPVAHKVLNRAFAVTAPTRHG